MNEQAETPEIMPAQSPAPVAASAELPPKEVEDGKAFAILSYAAGFIGVPFFIVPLIMRNNTYSLYHAKQCLMLWIVGVIAGSVAGFSMLLCIGFILLPIVGITMLVLDVMGLINALNGQMKPLPVIGKWGENWFKGITKA